MKKTTNKFSSLNKDQLKELILNDPDFIWSKKYKFSLQYFLLKNKMETIDNKKIAKLLLIEEEEVEKIYNEIIKILRKALND